MASLVPSRPSDSVASHMDDATNKSRESQSHQEGQLPSLISNRQTMGKLPATYDHAMRITERHLLSSRHSSATSKRSVTARCHYDDSQGGGEAVADEYSITMSSLPAFDQASHRYELPATMKNSLEKWKREKERFVEQRLLMNIKEKKRKKQEEQEAAEALERKLPMDILAGEWFSDDSQSVEVRVYLIENLMPTLILGMEKVLQEAERRNLILKEHVDCDHSDEHHGSLLPRPKFNPINELAQYLMRNNPKFSNFPEASPYARGLRVVAEDLKQQVFDLRSNRIAELKHKARQRREEMEVKERKRMEEEQRRCEMMKLQFSMWLLNEEKKLQLQLVQNGLFSYLEISAHLSTQPENVARFSKELEPTDETGLTVNVTEFVQFLEEHLKDLSFENFQDVLRHLNQCALAFRKTYEHEIWNSMFVKLFESLDSEKTGYIDRHRILHLLEKFWDQIATENRGEMRNPRKWPVIELEELDDLFPESDNEDSVKVSTEETDEPGGPNEENVSTSLGLTETTVREEVPKQEVPSEEKKETHDDVYADETEGEEESERPADVAMPTEELEIPESEASSRPTITEVVKMNPTDQTPQEQKTTEEIDTGTNAVAEELVEEPHEKVTEAGDAHAVIGPKIKEKQEDKQDFEKESTQDEPVEDEPIKPELEQAKHGRTESPEVKEITNEADETEDKSVAIEEKEPEKEPEKGKAASDKSNPDMMQLLSNATQGIIMNTPTITDDGISSEAVKIQFSKERTQEYADRQVRKTTSYSIVLKKKSQDEESKKIPEDAFSAANDYAIPAPVPSQTGSKMQEDGTEEFLSTYFEGSSSHLVQHVAEEMEQDLFPYPMQLKTRPASASRMSVTFAAEPIILPDKPSQEFFSEFSSRSQSRMTSVFDENQLNKSRFVTLLETFFDEDATHHIVESLLNFLHLGYIETEEEKMERLARAHREALSSKHREMIENIFNKWDNDGRGYLDIEVVEDVLSKYKGGMEASALKRGRQAVRQTRKHRFHDSKITRKEFHIYINAVCGAMAGGEEVFDGVIEFVTSTVERTFAESIRGDARRKWLAQIKSAAECSGASMVPVYRFIFQTLFKDAESHGGQKKISAYIALLESNHLYPNRGDLLLRYVACTPDNAPYILGKAYFEDMKGISFYCVRRGKLVHVPRVHSHGRVYFWNQQRYDEDKEASLVLLPIKDDERRVFGLIGVDNLVDPADRSIFATHELNFYQGVAKAFSSAFRHVDLKRKLLRIIDSAMSWIHSRAPLIVSITVFFVELDPKSHSGNVLRKMMFADNNTGVTQIYQKPSRLYRKDNLFRDYLFKCMDSSDTTTADAYGEHHTAYPLRSAEGHCQCVVDISLGKLRELPKHEAQEMQRMLKLLQAANAEVLRESSGGKRTIILEAEEKASDETRVEIMFDRLMLTDLRENVLKLDNNVFAELHNYKIPPPMIHNILKAVLMLFYQNEEEFEQFDDWIKCKQLATMKLRQQIVTFDPTASGAVSEDVSEKISGLLKGIAHGTVACHGSMPAQQLYNWAFVCLSLIEHTKKSGDSTGQPAVTPLTSASTETTTDTQDTVTY